MNSCARFPSRRPGSMYVAVLGCATVVTVLGVSAILVARIEGRVLGGCADLAAARHLAHSSVDLGIFSMYDEPSWRTTKSQGAWRLNESAGDGAITLSAADPFDGVLSDAKWESVVFTATGAVRDARYMIEATTLAEPRPLPLLNTCLHAGGKVTAGLLKSVTASGAPISMNSSVNGPGTFTGTVHAASTGIAPIIIGTSVIPSAAKEMPDAGVFNMYKGLATTITGITTIDGQVLTATNNPWGSPNPDGVYFIDTGGSDLTIKQSRIQATLVIKCGTGRKVLLDDALLLQGHRPDYPTLLVDGILEIGLNSTTTTLNEANYSINFNPANSPYAQVTDADISDSYPNEVQGLIHATGLLTLSRTSIIRGVLITNGNVSVTGTPQLFHNATLYSRPPLGYVTYAMQLASGSWRRVVNP